jgi:hypothetical protein
MALSSFQATPTGHASAAGGIEGYFSDMLKLPLPPQWRKVPPAEQDYMVPLPLVGENPTLEARTSTYSALVQKPFVGERLLVSKVGAGRLSAQLFTGPEIATADGMSFDPEMIGSATAFGTRLNLVVQPGLLIRMVVTWDPTFTCWMTVEEYERRFNKDRWSSKVKHLGKAYKLEIQASKVRLQMVDAKRYREISAAKLVRDFNPHLDLKMLLLGRIIH